MTRTIRTAALTSALVLSAALRLAADSLSISVRLTRDGTALVEETWAVTPYRGTEWYLVRTNLGDIRIEDFSVRDESGRLYTNIGSDWDVNRSREWKEGKCGIVSRDTGVELCWGIGTYAPHTYIASYRMTNAVKGLRDYDCLHLQLVSPGINDVPSRVQVSISADTPLSTDNSRVWGFGYEGSIAFEDGAVRASSDSFDSRCSVIVLLRLDKGLLSPVSVQDKDFDTVLSRAMEGADFGQDDSAGAWFMLGFIAVMAAGIWGSIRARRKRIYNITGHRSLKEIGWHREAPFHGDVLQSAYALKEIERKGDIGAIASAMILRMIQHGQITVHSEGRKDKVYLSFNDSAAADGMSKSGRQLYDMLKEAAGGDALLQDKEFSRWNRHHTKAVTAWAKALEAEGRASLVSGEFMSLGGTWSDSGREQAAATIGLRKFLKDYTLIDERRSAEAVVWNDYLVFGALFGIADKVAKELSDINPQLMRQTLLGDEYTARRVIILSDSYGRALTDTAARAASSARASARGFGGSASFGGGGGFSGGGFGGGAR